MRKRAFFLFFLVWCTAALCGAQTFQGFLHYRWGTPFEKMTEPLGLRFIQAHGRVSQYASTVDSLGPARLADCDFEFTSGKFSGVFLTTRGAGNSRRLLAVLQSMFGSGATDDTLGFLWMSGDTSVAYDEDSAGDSTIYWYCISMQQ